MVVRENGYGRKIIDDDGLSETVERLISTVQAATEEIAALREEVSAMARVVQAMSPRYEWDHAIHQGVRMHVDVPANDPSGEHVRVYFSSEGRLQGLEMNWEQLMDLGRSILAQTFPTPDQFTEFNRPPTTLALDESRE